VNVKPGDLAIVVGDDCPAKGAIVEVLRASEHPLLTDWFCKFVGGPGRVYRDGTLTTCRVTYAEDRHLRALPGIPDEITTEREETV
jgi:hypothetical protein